MKLKDKLFTMRNDQPYLTAVGVHIPEFKALHDADKSEDKTEYAKQLAYIYHMHEYDSPYYDRKEKESEIIKDFMGKKTWKPNKKVQAALAKYKSLDECAERQVLDAAISVCNLIAGNIQQLTTDSAQFNSVIKELDAQISKASKDSSITERTSTLQLKLDLQEQQMKILANITKTMPQLEKAIDTSLALRRKVTTAVFKGEGSDSRVGKFLMESLMDELQYESLMDNDK